jgi:hypothetical protein
LVVGLSFEQLAAIWRESIDTYAKQLRVDELTAELGIKSPIKNMIDSLRLAYPKYSDEQLKSTALFIAPFFNAIVKNNEAIAESLHKQHP